MASRDPIDATLDAADAPAPDHDAKPDDPPKLVGASWKYAVKRALKEFGTDQGTDLAAMLTYYTVLSLAPGLLAVFSIVSLVLANNASVVTQLVDQVVERYVPADYRALVVDLVETLSDSATGGVIALIIGIATAVWAASAYVKAFSRSMNTIYGIEEGRGLVKQTATMLLITIALLVGVFLVLVSLALNETLVTGLLGPIAEPLGLGGVVAFMSGGFLPVWAWLKWPVILALVIVMIALLYYLAPNLKQPKLTWVSIGSVVAIIGMAIAAVGLWVYFTLFAGYSSYGTIGTVMALLFALWIFNMVLLLGAELDAEIERARELQTGIEAEAAIQLPPRSIKKVEKKAAARESLEAEGRRLREEHGSVEADASEGSERGERADAEDDAARPQDEDRSGDPAAAAEPEAARRRRGARRRLLGIFPRRDKR